MRWTRRRGDRVVITSGKYTGHTGTIKSNVFQRTVDCAEEFAYGFQVMLDGGKLVIMRWDQVERLI